MKEIIEQLVKKANLDEAGAEKVLDIVKDFVEDKLPKPIAKQVANALDGVDGKDVGGALDGVKGLFGKKK